MDVLDTWTEWKGKILKNRITLSPINNGMFKIPF